MVEVDKDVNEITADILFDPQTSGGLLISVPTTKADELLRRLHTAGINDANIIGDVLDSPKGKILVR
jgi:selenide,water dikinase